MNLMIMELKLKRTRELFSEKLPVVYFGILEYI